MNGRIRNIVKNIPKALSGFTGRPSHRNRLCIQPHLCVSIARMKMVRNVVTIMLFEMNEIMIAMRLRKTEKILVNNFDHSYNYSK